MIIFNKLTLLTSLAAASLSAACEPKEDHSNGSEPHGDDSQRKHTSSNEEGGSDDHREDHRANEGDNSQPGSGSLSIDMTGVSALGVGEVDSTTNVEVQDLSTGQSGQVVLGLTGQTEKLLTKVKNDGRVAAVRFPDYGFGQPSIQSLYGVGRHGMIMVMDARYFSDNAEATMAWIKSDGKIVPFAPQNYSDSVGKSFYGMDLKIFSDTMWMRSANQNSLWKFDFNTATFSRYTDDGQSIVGFSVNEDGLVIMNSRLTSVGGNPPLSLRALKPNGGLEEFSTARGREHFDDSISLGSSLLIYSTLIDLNDDQSVRMRHIPIHASGRVSGVELGAFTIDDDWAIFPVGDQPVALRAGSSGQFPAANPFRKTPLRDPYGGTLLNTAHTNVNRGQSLFFDGANIVKVSKVGTSYVSTVHKNISMPTGLAVQVLRVFGEDHGFTGTTYGAIGMSTPNQWTYKYWWLEISKATGVVDTENAKELLNAYPATGATNASQWPQVSTIYKVGSTLVGVEQDANGHRIFELTPSGSNYNVQTTKTTGQLGNFGSSTTLNGEFMAAQTHAFAASYQNKLYFGVWDGIRTYDPGNDSVAWISGDTFFGGAIQTDEESSGNCAGNRANRHVMAVIPPFETGMTGPAAVMRLCDGDNDYSTPMIYTRFTDWNFTTSTGANISLDVSRIASGDNRRFPEPILIEDGGLTFVKRWQDELYVNSITQSSTGDVRTTNMFLFGNALRDGTGISVASDWTGNAVFISGKNISNQYRSYYVNPTTRVEQLVTALNGIQMYSATRLGEEVLISGLRLSDNKKITAYVRTDGSLQKMDEQSNVKISKLVPFNPTNN